MTGRGPAWLPIGTALAIMVLWGGTPVTVRLEDLDKMCAALNCTVADLLQAEPLAGAQGVPESGQRAVGAEEGPTTGPVRPVPRSRRGTGPRSLPPN